MFLDIALVCEDVKGPKKKGKEKGKKHLTERNLNFMDTFFHTYAKS